MTKVNNTPMTPDKGFSIYQALLDEREINVHILRKGPALFDKLKFNRIYLCYDPHGICVVFVFFLCCLCPGPELFSLKG